MVFVRFVALTAIMMISEVEAGGVTSNLQITVRKMNYIR